MYDMHGSQKHSMATRAGQGRHRGSFWTPQMCPPHGEDFLCLGLRTVLLLKLSQVPRASPSFCLSLSCENNVPPELKSQILCLGLDIQAG